VNVNEPESAMEAFVLRIWVEGDGGSMTPAEWRGSITNVMSGNRRTVRSLDQVTDFLGEHLRRLGADPGPVRE
jgi:hypothetical protein